MSLGKNMDLPHNIEIEHGLLAALLHTPKAYPHVAGIAKPECFYSAECGSLMALIVREFTAGRSVTPSSLSHLVESDPSLAAIGGKQFVYSLAANPVTILNVKDYAKTIRDLWQRRQLIGLGEHLTASAADFSEDVTADVLAARASSAISETVSVTENFEGLGDVAGRIVEGLDKPIDADSTGIECIDDVLMGGLHPGRFYGFGGRYKSGKSFLLTSMSYNMAERGVPHVYLTLESSSDGLAERFLARRMKTNASGFQTEKTRQSVWFQEKAVKAQSDFRKSSLVFRRRPRMSLDDLRSTLGLVGMSGKYRGVVVDYLQLVTGQKHGQSLTIHLEAVAQALAEAAIEYGIWVVAAVQLNQEGGVRHGEGLLLACDAAYALHRNDKEFDHEANGAWLECLAHRYGPGQDIGSDEFDAVIFDTKIGPHFRDAV
jgi:replicative DNA helicase